MQRKDTDMSTPKPDYRCNLDLIQQNFPLELQDTPAWCVWRYQWRDTKNGKPGKWTKVPYQPSGSLAKSNTRSTWSPFSSVSAAYKRGKYAGVGFFLFPPLVGVDFDKVRDPLTGKIDSWAQDIITGLDSYAEVSPSGTGVHVWTTGELSPEARNRVGQIEVYQLGRYFTVSGVKL
jgi:putative DNA primase/helicase